MFIYEQQPEKWLYILVAQYWLNAFSAGKGYQIIFSTRMTANS